MEPKTLTVPLGPVRGAVAADRLGGGEGGEIESLRELPPSSGPVRGGHRALPPGAGRGGGPDSHGGQLSPRDEGASARMDCAVNYCPFPTGF